MGLVIILCAVVYTARTNTVKANPLGTRPSVQTALATTTQITLTPGTGTTTLVHNAFASGLNRLSTGALLQFQVTATSSATVIKFRIEYSTDNIDWYPISYQGTSNATTTALADNFTEYTWRPATTTLQDTGGTATTSPSGAGRFNQAMFINTYAQYTRVKFYMPYYTSGVGTSTNAMLWAKISPVGEVP